MTTKAGAGESRVGMIEVLDPTGRANPVPVEIAERVVDLKGKIIGFLDNGKPNADVMLARLRDLLSERFQLSETFTRLKSNTSSAADTWIMDEMVQKCHAVIISTAD